MSDFKIAAEQESTCNDCHYYQLNLKVANVSMQPLCMHKDNKQIGLHGETSMQVRHDFLCNRFELYEEIY